MKILAIDPGNIESAYVIFDGENVLLKNKVKNDYLLHVISISNKTHFDVVLIENVACYGQRVGKEVFDTVFWIGRFYQRFINIGFVPNFVYRKEIVTHFCNSAKENDSAVRIVLQDRFAPNTSNYGKGTKKNPGYFFGFAKDMWQAFAIAAYWYESKVEKKLKFVKVGE